MPFARLVVAYDGSEESRAAARFALALAAARGAQVTLAHVLERPELYSEAPDAPDMEALAKEAEGRVREELETIVEQVSGEVEAGIEVVLSEDKAAAALLELVRSRDADLLVAGTRGVGGLKRALLGSVSQKLLEHAPCSVLLVRGAASLEGRVRVVTGLDGSDATRSVLAAAQRVAAALSAELVLVYVVDERLPFGTLDATEKLREWAHQQGEKLLHEARATITAPVETVIEDVRQGSTREELVDACDQHEATLAVVGSRGQHGFAGLLLGSNARYLVDHAPCPVLVVRDGQAQ